ncbi:hypothetical protein [Herbaspirillum sp. YR522]|uniref:hypothetical protein n=1 Tax=Herbaspirillum sp. YR522 TaxID=1144342 RepID=UPI0012F7BA95|nr:hypothetical protein [Herbaspirillum sp. YR522]
MPRTRGASGPTGGGRQAPPEPTVDVIVERRGRGYAVQVGERMKPAGDDGDSFYRAVLLGLGQTRGDEVASHDIQALRNDVADTLLPRLNSGLLRIWWQNRRKRTGLSAERYIERYIRSPGSWDEPLAQLLPVIVPSCATWRRLGGSRLMVDAPGYGRHADKGKPGPAPAVRASELWAAFVKGDTNVLAPMDGQVLRDKPLALSLLTRSASITLDHPRDAVEMRAVPADLTVHFSALAAADAADDQRNLILLPSATTLVDTHGSLPTIDVQQAIDSSTGALTYTVTDIGRGATVRFVFAPGVACPALQVLDVLQRAAQAKQAATVQTLHLLMHADAPLTASPPAHRATMARLWSDLSDEVRRRVLAGFTARQGIKAIELDVVRELKSGTEPERVALATDMLVSALDLWPARREVELIPFSFWLAEMAQAMAATGGWREFIQARGLVRERHVAWQHVRADLGHWLHAEQVGGNPALSVATRECLAASLARADDKPSPAPEKLRGMPARQVRERLAATHADIVRRRRQAHDAPEVVIAALSHCAADVCGSGDGDGGGEMADDPAAGPGEAVPPGSRQWASLVADTGRAELRLDRHAARDQPIDLSLLQRPATLVLDHPGDIVQMQAIPAGATVRFDPAPPDSVGSDQRWLVILPGQSDFLGQAGPLPSIDISKSAGAQLGWEVYTLFDTGRRIGCRFTFAGPVAPRVRRVLDSLKQAADDKWSAFRSLYADARAAPRVVDWGAERRRNAAGYWRAFPALVKDRVLGYYRRSPASQAPLRGLDIAELLDNAAESSSMALAREVLISAMDYWDDHGEADDIGAVFWTDASHQEPAGQASHHGFEEMLERILQAHRRWQETSPPFTQLLRWLSQPVLEDDADYVAMHAFLGRAMRRAGGEVIESGSRFGDSLAGATAAQLRQRLGWIGPALVSDDPDSARPALMVQALQPWMACIGGAEPIVLGAGSRIDTAAVRRNCVPAGCGLRGVRYLIDANLPASEVAGLFAIDATLLADGSLPLEQRGQVDGTGDGARWARSYRIWGPWTYDAARRSWQRTHHEMSVEGTVVAQRHAFDRHINSLLREMGSAQSFSQFAVDRQRIEIKDNACFALMPQSRFDRRTVSMSGAGGLLLLPGGLRGTVTIDLAALRPDAGARIEADPELLEHLLPRASITIDGRTFLQYGRDDEDTIAVQIGPQESGHPLCGSLTVQLRAVGRKQFVEDLADETKVIILVSPVLDDEIVLPPVARDVLLYASGKTQKFVIVQIGPGRLQLLCSTPLDQATANLSLRLELTPELLPRYGVSDMVLGSTGYITGAVRDNRDGGMVIFGCTPGVKLDRNGWQAGAAAISRLHDAYIDHLLDWDDRLRRGAPFGADTMELVVQYGNAVVERADVTLLQRAAVLSGALEARQQAELAGAGATKGAAADERRTASAVLAQLLVFSLSHVFDGVSDAEWRKLVAAGDTSSMSERLVGMYVDMAWQREHSDEFYAGLAGLYRFLQMSTTDPDVEASLARDEACIDAALELVAGESVGDDALRQTGLEHFKGSPERVQRLKLTLVARRDERLFDDDPLWRDRLLHELRRPHARSRRSGVLDLLSAVLAGHGGRDAVLLAYQHRKTAVPSTAHTSSVDATKRDVVLFDHLSTQQLQRTAPAGTAHRLRRNVRDPVEPINCRLVSVVNFTGALLIFIGDLGTVVSKWQINEPGSPTQRFATMYFQIIKAAGWSAQQVAAFACQPEAEGAARFILVTAPVVGLGMGFNYLAGGLTELVVRTPRTRWTWRQDMRPLVARMPGARASKVMQLIDVAGNIYLVLAEAAKIATLSQQAERAQGSDIIGASTACASALLGAVAAGGEFGSKTLLTPAKQFYQAAGLSSSLLNLCSASTAVVDSGTLRADDDHHEL